MATASSTQEQALKARPQNGTPGEQGRLTPAGASTLHSVKEEGGSSCRPVLTVGGSFRRGGLGGGLLGISAVWAFASKGLVREGRAGWAMPRPWSLSASGLSREKAGAAQAAVPS